MVVRKGKDFSDALIFHKTPQHDDPTLEIVLPVDYSLIPGGRLLLDSVAISEKSLGGFGIEHLHATCGAAGEGTEARGPGGLSDLLRQFLTLPILPSPSLPAS